MRSYLRRAIILVTAATASAPAYAQMYPGYGYDGWGWGWGHMIFGSVMMIGFWAGVILVVILAVRWLGGGTRHKHTESSNRTQALDVLKERFARGEIDQQEFEERKRLLID